MSAWSELKKEKRTSTASGSISLLVLILYPDADNPQFEICVEKWIENGPPKDRITCPQGWISLWPRPPLAAARWPEIDQLRTELLDGLNEENSCEGFEIRPSFLEALECVVHPKVPRVARIYRQRTGNYQINFEASFLPSPWIPKGYEVATVASTLGEAHEVAWLFFQGCLDGTIGFHDDWWKTNKPFPLGLTSEGYWPVREI